MVDEEGGCKGVTQQHQRRKTAKGVEGMVDDGVEEMVDAPKEHETHAGHEGHRCHH